MKSLMYHKIFFFISKSMFLLEKTRNVTKLGFNISFNYHFTTFEFKNSHIEIRNLIAN